MIAFVLFFRFKFKVFDAFDKLDFEDYLLYDCFPENLDLREEDLADDALVIIKGFGAWTVLLNTFEVDLPLFTFMAFKINY